MTPAEKRELRAYCASGDNCSSCKYPDCIYDGLTERDCAEIRQRNATTDAERARWHAYYEKNKARIKEKSRLWYQAHREKQRAYQKEYQKTHRAEISARKRAYYAAHKEKCKAASRASALRRKQNAAPVPKHESGALCGEDRNQI